ncbi:hypothetical protein tb265_11700 [Gemmatimonadetes bacterium T265]|nr:hypothetical protein tb265_11700 [Gemmatimonadetes bacterium T265]
MSAAVSAAAGFAGVRLTPYIGYAAGALTVLSLVPQVGRAYRTRHVDDLSWGLVTLLGVSGALWLVYGLLTAQLPVILTNAGVTLLAGTLVVAKALFRPRRAGRGRQPGGGPAAGR